MSAVPCYQTVSYTHLDVYKRQLLRGALLDWGVPEIATTDNGQEYVSHHLARIFHALGIDQQTSQPFSPWQKPVSYTHLDVYKRQE